MLSQLFHRPGLAAPLLLLAIVLAFCAAGFWVWSSVAKEDLQMSSDWDLEYDAQEAWTTRLKIAKIFAAAAFLAGAFAGITFLH